MSYIVCYILYNDCTILFSLKKKYNKPNIQIVYATWYKLKYISSSYW